VSSSALIELAKLLRDEDTVISPCVSDPDDRPLLGELAAAGPRTREAASDYAFVVEAIREGYLLHYGAPRVVDGAGEDLRLLAGDYLYALGLERIAALGDPEAVRELSDLISLCAQLHTEGRDGAVAASAWLAAAVAAAAGPPHGHEEYKTALRGGDGGALPAHRVAAEMRHAARNKALEVGIDDALAQAAEAIDLPGLT
jgi:hypothetical protein